MRAQLELDQMPDSNAMIKKWREIMKHALHAAFYRNLLVAVAHWVHQPWNYLKAKEFFTPKSILFPAPTVKKEEIKEVIRKQKTCTHTMLGKSTIDGRGTNAKMTIKTCRQCLMRWKWQPKNPKDPKGPGDWKTVPNPSLGGVRAQPELHDPVDDDPPQGQNRPASSSGSSWRSRQQPQPSWDQMEEDSPQTNVHDMTQQDSDHDSWVMTESEAPSVEVEEDF